MLKGLSIALHVCITSQEIDKDSDEGRDETDAVNVLEEHIIDVSGAAVTVMPDSRLKFNINTS